VERRKAALRRATTRLRERRVVGSLSISATVRGGEDMVKKE
jgi:hypothetical protein